MKGNFVRCIVSVFLALCSKPLFAEPAFEYVAHEDEAGISYRLALAHQHGEGVPVLYIHGSSFPSALSIGWKFSDGISWADNLHEAGYDVWGLDFAGYGRSDRPDYAAIDGGFSRSAHAAAQIHTAAQHIIEKIGAPSVSLIAHSWGTIPAALFASEYPDLVDKLVLFGPIVARQPEEQTEVPKLPAFRLVTTGQQRTRFLSEVPDGLPPVLEEPDLKRWGRAYLASDPGASKRMPPSVQVPSGPIRDALQTWAGDWLYDPARIKSPTLVIRGEWDTASTAEDLQLLFSKLGSAEKRIGTIPQATHLMHLETGRHQLWQAVRDFFLGR